MEIGGLKSADTKRGEKKNHNKKKIQQKKKSSVDIIETSGGKDKSQKLRVKKRKQSVIVRRDPEDVVASHVNEAEDTTPDALYNEGEASKDKLLKPRKKKRKNVEGEASKDKLLKPRKKKGKNVESINHFDESIEKNDESEQCKDSKPEEKISNSGGLIKRDKPRKSKKSKSKGPEKMKEKKQLVENNISSDSLMEKRAENVEDEVYQMSSGDEDYSKGMKKWITQYHQSRPGLKVLQERIDDFIMDHEAKEEQARAEKLAQAAEGGWTVVTHQKGRKKTTDAESGIVVGSVAQAAVLDKMGKKKKNDVGLDFYNFNRREAHRNEIMMLQSKFEQDKQRIQQMRAARKFRPY